MLETGEKLGAFIVPTGIGASIGGYAGDASNYAKRFAQYAKLIVNPNVVNAGCFSGITENMFYVEGYSLDEFFKNNLTLKPSTNNNIGVVFDKAIPQEVLNVHINTINAVKTVYGINISEYEITEQDVGVKFYINNRGISVGNVENIETLKHSAQNLIKKGANAIAIVCMFDESADTEYSQGIGVDPVGGVEAILSHYISKKLKVPCAHSPAFADYNIYPELVNPKASAEYITPTFLPCILLGLANAPVFGGNISIDNLDYLIIPYNALGSTPVFEAIKRNIPIYAIKENKSVLNVTNDNLHKSSVIKVLDTYEQCLNLIHNN